MGCCLFLKLELSPYLSGSLGNDLHGHTYLFDRCFAFLVSRPLPGSGKQNGMQPFLALCQKLIIPASSFLALFSLPNLQPLEAM